MPTASARRCKCGMAKPESWSDYLAMAAAKAHCTAVDVSQAIMQLIVGIEGQLRAQDDEDQAGHRSHATELIDLASDAELWHTPGADGEAWATIEVDGHREHWPVRVKPFRRWLAARFHAEHRTSPGSQALQDALTVLEGKALFEGQEYSVYTRLAGHDGKIYLDLGNEAWQAVEVDATGWRVIDAPPVKFRRSRGMLPLPVPVAGGRLDDLRGFVNITDDADWQFLVGWLLGALRPTGPYPVKVLHGEQGSAKSTTARLLRALVDPNTAPLRSEPRDARDIMIAGTNGWLIALDHLPRMADFAVWTTAAEPARGWQAGAFLDAYRGNRAQANDLALEAAVIVAPLRDLLASKGGSWQGTATELLHDLDEHAPERTRKTQGWPTSGRSVSNALRRIAPNLRQAMIDVAFEREGKDRKRKIRLTSEQEGKSSSAASAKIPTHSGHGTISPCGHGSDDLLIEGHRTVCGRCLGMPSERIAAIRRAES
jgi:hypothetical protein